MFKSLPLLFINYKIRKYLTHSNFYIKHINNANNYYFKSTEILKNKHIN